MRLHELKARSFLAFPGEVTVNLDELGPGLIALVGPNGHGKSTLLELLFTALYRTSPSRKSALTDLVHGSKDASIEAAFTNGDSYRAKVLINGHSRKMEAYLFQEGEPIVSGKCPEFDAAVRERFGPSELWLASVLACQRHRGDFLRAPRSERKQIFAELLGLAELQRHHETAKEAGQALEGKAAGLSQAVAEIESRLEDREQLQERAAVIATDVRSHRESIQGAEKRQETARGNVATLEGQKIKAQESRGRVAHLEGELNELNRQHDAAEVAIVDAITQTNRRVQEQRGVLAQGDGIREAQESIQGIEASLKTAGATLAEAKDVVATGETSLAALRVETACVPLVRERLSSLTSDTKILQNVPCATQEDPYRGCAFLARGHAAMQGSATVKLELAELKVKEAELLAIEPEVGAYRTAVQDAERIAMDLRTALERARLSAAKVDALETAERRIQEIERDHTKLSGSLQAEMARLQPAIVEKSLEVGNAQHLAKGLDGLDDDLRATQTELREAEFALRLVSQALEQRVAEQGSVKGRLEALQQDATRRDEVQHQLSGLHREAADWNLLAKATGKDGIQALEIDASGPEVSGIANELMAGCYGTRFSLWFETTALKRDGGQKEVFDIRILDEGQERLVEDLSGGEETIIRESISLALAIFHARRSGLKFETLFRDETAGALDPEHAQRYVRMLRQALQVGGFHQLLFVSHSPEVWEQADAQVHVEQGTIRIGE